MARKDCIFTHYEIITTLLEGETNVDFNFRELIDYIWTLPEDERFHDFSLTKFGSLEHFRERENRYYLGYFKSAAQGRKGDLIDRATKAEREDPKNITEGNKVRTHFGIIFTPNPIIVLQKRGDGLSISQVLDYFNGFYRKRMETMDEPVQFNLDFNVLLRENFREEIMALNRVVEGKIYMERRVLGSDFLDLSNRLENVQDTFIIDVSAEKRSDIKGLALDAFEAFRLGRAPIQKIWIKGKDASNVERDFNTEKIEKRSSTKIEWFPLQGEFDSDEIIEKLPGFLREYNVG